MSIRKYNYYNNYPNIVSRYCRIGLGIIKYVEGLFINNLTVNRYLIKQCIITLGTYNIFNRLIIFFMRYLPCYLRFLLNNPK